ncbi:MAG: hypothetical protein WCL50_07930 [Spirochaetota bacterium]
MVDLYLDFCNDVFGPDDRRLFAAKDLARSSGLAFEYRFLYAALGAARIVKKLGSEDVLRGLFIAAGVGAIAFTRAEPTGKVRGCAGECGV